MGGQSMELIDLVVCPRCHGGLARGQECLSCDSCGQDYPLYHTAHGGIPDLLAGPLTPEEDLLIANYDVRAAEYDTSRLVREYGWRLQEMDCLLLKQCRGRVLEIGCGSGRLLQEARGRADQVAGIDPSLGMLIEAASKRLPVVRGRGEALPFPDGSMDSVISGFHAMMYAEQTQGFREARRVLRRGGRFAFTLPNARNYEIVRRLAVLASRLKKRDWRAVLRLGGGGPPSPVGERGAESITRLEESLGQAGFRVLELWATAWPDLLAVLPFVGHRLWRGRWGAFFGYDVIVVCEATI